MVVLDLRELRFIDSAGVRVVVEAAERARREGHRLAVVRGPRQVDRAFKLIRTDELVETFDLGLVVPPVQVLVQFAAQDARRASATAAH